MQQLSLIMFSCKHELASIVTHCCNLMGIYSKNDDQPTRLLGVISLQTKELYPSNFVCSLLTHARPFGAKKKIFATATLIRLKPPTTHKKVLQWLVFLDWVTFACHDHGYGFTYTFVPIATWHNLYPQGML